MTTKKCSRCNIEKNINEFYAAKGRVRNWCKECDKYNTIIRQTVFKELCVEYKGGKCEKCGYNKYIGALQFHHKDPSKKDFNISRCKNRVFDDSIKEELDKCNLLCANCHFEIHQVYNIKETKETWILYDKQKDLIRNSKIKKQLIDSKCVCGNQKSLKANKCVKCNNKNATERNLEEVITKIKETNFVQAAKYFNITDNGLRKFLKSKGIDPKNLP